MIRSQGLRLLKPHMGFDNLYSSVVFSSNSSGVVDWWISGLTLRIWCIDGGALHQELGDRLRLQRRCSVREGVPEWEEMNICLLQHQNEIGFPLPPCHWTNHHDCCTQSGTELSSVVSTGCSTVQDKYVVFPAIGKSFVNNSCQGMAANANGIT